MTALKKGIIPIILCVLLLSVSKGSYAQLAAKFSANTTSGCAPVIIQFTDQSAGSPNQWRWDLGNGVISALQHPSATYFNPGTYNVKLVIRNAAGTEDSVTKSQFITVYGNPTPDFTASATTGCVPFNVQFNDASQVGSGTVSSYEWDFGDGYTAIGPRPAHVYRTPGTYSVTLRITNSNGCVKAISKDQLIQANGAPHIDFSYTSSGSCSAPVTINFTDASTGTAPLTYQWSFGNGATSTAQSPVYTYTANGSYSVKLVVTNGNGCTDTLLKNNLINIGNLHSDFSVSTPVCEKDSLHFANTSNPMPASYKWNFGDNTTADTANPVKVYAVAGTYTVKLINNFGACTDTVTKAIVVNAKPKVDFTAPTAQCSLPATVKFTNNTIGGASYFWDFGDNQTSTQKNPIHIYNNTGKYTVKLFVTSASGCLDSLVKAEYINVAKPGINFSLNGIYTLPIGGCVPFTINALSEVNSNQPVISYFWDFGDKTSSNLQNPSHTYTDTGHYKVKLVITTAGGCVDSLVVSNAVTVGTKPTADFTVTPTDACSSVAVSFIATVNGRFTDLFWDFGDDSNVQPIKDLNTTHQYSDTGWFNVSLTASDRGCTDKIKKLHIVHIKPPIALFRPSMDCDNRLKVDLVNQSKGAQTYQWDFGDGKTSTLESPTHIYSTQGKYTITLTVTNDTCSSVAKHEVELINESPIFIWDSVVCANQKVSFIGIDNRTNVTARTWNIYYSASHLQRDTFYQTFSIPGTYSTKVETSTWKEIIDGVPSRPDMCSEVAYLKVKVFGPKADFNVLADSKCLDNNKINYIDKSQGDGTNPIVKWIWNYGDNTIDSVSPAPFVHKYADTGTYNVSLKVVDSYGCTNSINYDKLITISKPFVKFKAVDSLSCTNKPVQFTNQSSGYKLQYIWDFGDNTQGLYMVDATHSYASIGTYDIKLLAVDDNGCSDSLTKKAYINISYPKALFDVSDSIGTCPPLKVTFTNSSTDYTSVQWDFNDGNTSAAINPTHYYVLPGTYYAKLTVTGPGGCTDVMIKKIVVRGPQGSFTYTPTAGCNPLPVSFTAHTVDNISFVWDYSDGSTFITNDSTVMHTYTVAGDYVPKMILKDASGCVVPIAGTETIHVKDVSAALTMDRFKLCDSGYVQFNSASLSNDVITSYEWTFGDNQNSTNASPSHHYNAPGVYTVGLTVTTQLGCASSATLTDTVKVFDSPIVQMLGDTAKCLPATINSSAVVNRGSNLTWLWRFGNGQTSTSQAPPTQNYTIAGGYDISVVATDNNGCKDSVTRTVYARPLPQTNAGPDALVCEGSAIQLTATGANTYDWNATPTLSCTTCAGPLAAPSDTTKYVVTGTNIYGCTSMDTVKINVRHPFTMQVNKGDTICVGSTVHLRASGADNYLWAPSASVDNPNAANTLAKPGTTTNFQVIGWDKDNCFADTGYVFVKVWSIPTVSAGVDQTIIVGTTAQLTTNASTDVTSYQWTPSIGLSCATCPNPVSKPKMDTKYTVEVSNDGGCKAQASVSVFVTCGKGNLFIPNTFSPNGDGNNDIFFPRGVGIGKIKSLRVFNRWGELVFEKVDFAANDESAGWDGRFKGQPLAADVYIYACEVVCENNEVLLYKGDLTLLK